MDTILYKKPKEICIAPNEQELYLLSLSDKDFIDLQKKEIEEQVLSLGYNFRFASYNDIDSLSTFIEARYTRLEGNELSPYDFYRFIKFGSGLILEKNNEIFGCVFEIAYDTPCKTSYPLRLVLDKSILGHNLGLCMVYYLSLNAMQRGSGVNRSVISFNNHKSLYVQLNKQGWISYGYNPDIKGLTSYFEVCIPLTKEGLLLNRIDMNKLLGFIEANKNKQKFELTECTNSEAIKQLFKKKHIIVALIKKDIIDNKNHYFSMPAETLGYKE